MHPDPKTEFSRIVSFDQIGAKGVVYHIEATAEECQLLASRFELVSISQLKAHFSLSHGEEPQSYRIEGEVVGDVVQACVSTLKDVPAYVQVSCHILLRPSRGDEEEWMIDLDDERDIEYYTQESIDLGETAAQYLYLNLDPFPHAPGALDLSEKPTTRATPFSQALKTLKKEKKES